MNLRDFVRESNRIEGIMREPTDDEIKAHEELLGLGTLTVPDIERFVVSIAPGKRLRRHAGMNVRVGRHVPPLGGSHIEDTLTALLKLICPPHSPFVVHCAYEGLHPFMDGNGRSGRAIWLWMMGGIENAPLGFLHHFYYQALGDGK